MALRLGARQTREGVCSTAHGPAHPVGGSRPRSRARRVYLHGESSGARAGMAIRSHDMPMPAARCPWCSLCLPPISGRHLRAIWSHTDLFGGPGAALRADADGPCMYACCARVAARVCADCGPNVPVSRCARMIFRGARVQNSGPFMSYVTFLDVLSMS